MPERYGGPERRGTCDQHERQVDTVEHLRDFTIKTSNHVAKIAGWNKALAFFIGLCFCTVVAFAKDTRDSISNFSASIADNDKTHMALISKLDKQILTTILATKKSQQHFDDMIVHLDSRVGYLEEKCLEIQKEVNK